MTRDFPDAPACGGANTSRSRATRAMRLRKVTQDARAQHEAGAHRPEPPYV